MRRWHAALACGLGLTVVAVTAISADLGPLAGLSDSGSTVTETATPTPAQIQPPPSPNGVDPKSAMSIFSQAQASRDVLPDGIGMLPAARFYGESSSSRLAVDSTRLKVFLVEGRAAGTVCLAAVFDARSKPPGVFGTCGSVDDMAKNGPVMLVFGQGDSRTLVGMALDNVKGVVAETSRFNVNANAFVLNVASTERTVRVENSDGSAAVVSLPAS